MDPKDFPWVSREEYDRLVAENLALVDNLTATQQTSNRLMEEARAARAETAIALAAIEGLKRRINAFDDYQVKAGQTSQFRDDIANTYVLHADSGLMHRGRERVLQAALGLSGEAGEVTDYLKKVIFHKHQLDVDKVRKELGDVLWYISEIALALGMGLESIALGNLAKLKDRYKGGQMTPELSQARKPEA